MWRVEGGELFVVGREEIALVDRLLAEAAMVTEKGIWTSEEKGKEEASKIERGFMFNAAIEGGVKAGAMGCVVELATVSR